MRPAAAAAHFNKKLKKKQSRVPARGHNYKIKEKHNHPTNRILKNYARQD